MTLGGARRAAGPDTAAIDATTTSQTAHDLVVLAIGMEPESNGISLPEDIVRDSSGFIEGAGDGGQLIRAVKLEEIAAKK